jgi:hypothetical protein
LSGRNSIELFANAFNLTDVQSWTNSANPLARRYGEVGVTITF